MSMINSSNSSNSGSNSSNNSGSITAVLVGIFRTESGRQRISLKDTTDGTTYTLATSTAWDCVPTLKFSTGDREIPVGEHMYTRNGKTEIMLVPLGAYVLDEVSYFDRAYVVNGKVCAVREVVGGTWREIPSNSLTVASTKKR